MGIPLYRLPFLVQASLFNFMELPDKFFLATLSKRSRRLSKILLNRQLVELKIRSDSIYEISLNGEKFSWCIKQFQAIQWSNAHNYESIFLIEIFVPCKDRQLDLSDLVRLYGEWSHMTLKMTEFLFELFPNLSISIITDDVHNTAKLLNFINSSKDKNVQKLSICVTYVPVGLVPPLPCDELTFKANLYANQLIQMAMNCKRVIVSSGHMVFCDVDSGRGIFEAWRNNSPIEYMELPFCKYVFKDAISDISERRILIRDTRYLVGYVISQANGEEAVVYHNNRNKQHRRVFFRTDVEAVMVAQE